MSSIVMNRALKFAQRNRNFNYIFHRNRATVVVPTNLDTLFASAGCEESDPSTGAVVAPLHLSTTFERRKDTLEYPGANYYIRTGNPTRDLFETTFAKIENGSEAFAFSSGMQACTTIVMAYPGSHILLPNDLYHGVYEIVSTIFTKWGATYERIDMTDHVLVQSRLEAVRDGIASTSHKKCILWLETPSNPKTKVSDIQQLSAIAKSTLGDDRVCVVVDSTWATPYLTRPLTLGADVVMHSTTKYVSGHSDVLAGMLVLGHTATARSILKDLRVCHQIGGGVCAPLESYLCLRGLRTLHVRMRRHCDSALALAQFLSTHPCVSLVHYPGLPTHPQHDVAVKQMGNLFGGMLSFELKNVGEPEALQVQH